MRAAAMVVLIGAVLGCTAEEPGAARDTAQDTAAASGAGAVAGGGMGPAADTALGGTRWVLVEVGGTAAVDAPPERAAYLELSPSEGRASGNTTCNRFSGPYSLSGDSLVFGALISTKMACVDSALNAQESAFLGALEQTRRWRMAGDTLVLAGGESDLARLRGGS